MKKYLAISILSIIVLFLTSCSPSPSDLPTSPVPDPSPQKSVPEQSPPEIEKLAETTPPSPLPPLEPEQKITTPQPTVSSTPPPEKPKSTPLAPKVRTTPPQTPPLPTTIFTDSFTGSSIDTSKYITKIKGNASIIQQDKIEMEGNSDKGISWSTLYTTKTYNVQEKFNLTADISLNSTVEYGSSHALLGLETLSTLEENKLPERHYCEISQIRNDKILRMSKTSTQLDPTTPLQGTITLQYDHKIGKLICTFNGQTITQYQDQVSGDYYGTLRAGINSASEGGGLETTGTGNYEVTFDNFFIKQN